MARDVTAARFELANGWTVSICPDVAPALCSVAAWPTGDEFEWFKFAGGNRDKRCWNAQDIIEAMAEIATAKPLVRGDPFA